MEIMPRTLENPTLESPPLSRLLSTPIAVLVCHKGKSVPSLNVVIEIYHAETFCTYF